MVTLATLTRPRDVSGADVAARAVRIRLVLTDCDGVLTDGGLYYSDRGEALRRFSVRDGMGVERLRADGIETGIVTRERSRMIVRRSTKLRLAHVFAGVEDKATALPSILESAGCPLGGVAYIGDDVNDLGILGRIAEQGLTGAPADAAPEVLAVVQYRCRARGGYGAFREFADWILGLRGAREREEAR